MSSPQQSYAGHTGVGTTVHMQTHYSITYLIERVGALRTAHVNLPHAAAATGVSAAAVPEVLVVPHIAEPTLHIATTNLTTTTIRTSSRNSD